MGQPPTMQFACSGDKIVGLDVDGGEVDAINSSKSYIKHISESEEA